MEAIGTAAGPGRGQWLEVARRDLATWRLVEGQLEQPPDGAVLLEVERFGFSANNITYALMGEQVGYWDLFPTSEGWGRIPVWGYLRVCSSAVPGIEVGRRALGLCPMGTHVVLRPERIGPSTFVEGSPHRSGLSSVYNSYSWADAGPGGGDDARLALRPLFWLSFTLDDHLARRRPGAGVVVTSASSKAAAGLAHLLSQRGVPVIGLTSPTHTSFVSALALYDRVLAYDELDQLSASDVVLVDVAGNAALRHRLERQLDGQLAEVVVAGATHGAPGSLASHGADGPKEFFFAPDQIRRLARESGWTAVQERFEAALTSFAESASWLEVVRPHGLEGAALVYQQVLGNTADPAQVHVVRMMEGEKPISAHATAHVY